MTTALRNLAARIEDCRGVLVDSNVLLDIATNDANWADWSARALAECADRTALIINPIVYAEVSIGFSSIEALDAALPSASYEREALSRVRGLCDSLPAPPIVSSSPLQSARDRSAAFAPTA
jgi:hypothetical protein